MDMRRLCTVALLISLSFSIRTAHAQEGGESSAPLKAIAVLQPTGSNNVCGSISITEVADGVRVVGEITGLTPGKHGFHVHEFGDCSADAASAGAHFNPTDRPHGAADDMERHVGDLGNIEADAAGTAKVNFLDHKLSLFHDARSIIGRALVVHEKADDLKSQPAGDSGARVACGVIGRAQSGQ